MPTLPGPPPLQITLRRSARARRFSLRVSARDGQVTLSLPLRAREAEAMAFVRAQEGWIRQALERIPLPEWVQTGALIPIEGALWRLEPTPGRRVLLLPAQAPEPGQMPEPGALRQPGPLLQPGRVLVPGEASLAGVRLAAFLRVLARERLMAASDAFAARLGRKISRITLRDTRSRWGSCTAQGSLMYSWRLIMAPPSVLNYVAAHEVAHMVEMNHAPAFWAVVESLFPDWRAERAWLRAHGNALQAINFAPPARSDTLPGAPSLAPISPRAIATGV